MKYGLVLGTMDTFSQPELVLNFAKLADTNNWDGIFFPDHLMHRNRISWMDPNVLMGAISSITKNIRMGTWITAVPRRLPWQLARDLVTLDQLSNGRISIGVGLGAPPNDYEAFGREYNLKLLAERLDESLEIMNLCWKGEMFSYNGKHFTLKEVQLLPKPVQSPRIPIYVGGYQPDGKKAIERAVKWDGMMPISRQFPFNFSYDDLETTINNYKERGGSGEIMIQGNTFGKINEGEFHDRAKELGATWLMYQIYPQSGPFVNLMPSISELEEFIISGPQKGKI